MAEACGSDFIVDSNELYKILSGDDIVKTLNDAVEDITSVFPLPATIVRILFGHLKWDKQRLMEQLSDDEESRDKLFAAANVINPEKIDNISNHVHGNIESIECKICCSRFSIQFVIGTDCGHKYCRDCWKQYLTLKICDEGAAEAINCPEPGCNIIVDDVIIIKLVTDPDTRRKYQFLMTSTFVEHNKLLRWCPGRGCSYAIKVNFIPITPLTITCKCGYQFCFDCGDVVHVPVPCDLLSKWTRENTSKQSDEEKTFDWLQKSTKKCPQCKTSIEKNGGCNHMTCKKCNNQFCWLCLGPWITHTASITGRCNRFDNNDDTTSEEAMKALKFRHYFVRYTNYGDAIGLQKKFRGSGESKQDEMMNKLNISWMDTKYILKGYETLMACRKFIMYSYVYAYYIEESPQKALFEKHQGDLDMNVESLAQGMDGVIVTTENHADHAERVKKHIKLCEQLKTDFQAYIDEQDWTIAEI